MNDMLMKTLTQLILILTIVNNININMGCELSKQNIKNKNAITPASDNIHVCCPICTNRDKPTYLNPNKDYWLRMEAREYKLRGGVCPKEKIFKLRETRNYN